MKLSDLLEKIEKFYPQSYAEDWDNIGLQVGDPNQDVKRVLTALELTDDVLDEAIEKQVDLIITHHPLIFKNPLKNITFDNTINKKIQKLIKKDIALYVMHTNVDIADNGMNDWIAEELGVTKLSVLSPTYKIELNKCELEITPDKLEDILELLKSLGISKTKYNLQNLTLVPKIKRYQTKSMKDAKEIDVVMISFTATDEQISLLKETLENIRINDKLNYRLEIFKLEDSYITKGLGRIGYIKPTVLENLAYLVKSKFDNDDVKIVGSREKIVNKIAIVGGSGGSLLNEAIKKGCDVLITGDISYHQAQDALENNIAIIDGGHYMEIIFNDAMASFLNLFEEIKVYPSELDINPFERI